MRPAEKGPLQEPAAKPAEDGGLAAGRTIASRPLQSAEQPPPDLAGQSVYVIDANSLIFQVFHAIPEMTSPRGEPVNAVFGFTRDVLHILETRKPGYLFCAFDMAGKTFRHDLYDQYKVNRSEMPDELVPQFPAIFRLLEALRIPVLGLESYEADDILATVARLTEEGQGECYLVSGDKDCRQLISEQIKIYNVRKDQVYDAAALAADWGVRPDQVVDFQALVGDPVDHVPGVPLIGPKLARELLEKYDTLESILDHAHEVAGAKRRQNLLECREQALLSRQLVRLDTQVPVPIDWQAGRIGAVDPAAALELFAEFGFHRFAQQLRARQGEASTRQAETNYRRAASSEDLRQLVAALTAAKRFGLHALTSPDPPADAELIGLSFAWTPGEAWFVPLGKPAAVSGADPAASLAALRGVLEDASIAKVGHDLKGIVRALAGAGIALGGLAFDTMMASYLLDAGERVHTLDELAERYLGQSTVKPAELLGTGKSQKRLNELPAEALTPYACQAADLPLRLAAILADKLREADLDTLFNTLELPLIEVLAELESRGIRVDVHRLAELSRQYGDRLETLEREIHALAGHPFNIASVKQLQQVLFEEQKLPVLARTKTGPSTDVSVLEDLARLNPQHELPAKIIAYRQYAKLKNTYVDALPALVNPRTGRVHATFQQAVAATGRLSSSDPNLQNIPIRTESGREIRSAFLPGYDDWLLLGADYSQIELRVLAHFSRDETLCRAFACDEDIHARVASQVFGVPIEGVTSDMRRTAKAVNFGVIYGQSPFGLAKTLLIDQDQAAQFIKAYFDRYRGVEEFLTKILVECRAKGYVSTILGRRRAIRGIRAVGGRQRNLPERTAINTVIQGSAADLIKQAMIGIHRRMRREKLAARMLLQIHDELVFEVPPDEIEVMARLVTEEMAGVQELAVPLKVDVKTGRNWAQTEPWV
ncbi:MAG: DNA polymerase I [Pirellulales bacterium]